MLSGTGLPTSVFSRPRYLILLATLCCLLWGSAYPAIKGGYALLGIARSDTAAQLVFAGWRFLLAGALLLVMAQLTGRRVWALAPVQWAQLGLLGLAQTALQYVFFYVGLANTTGVKGSILNATGTFFSVLLAHFLYANDRLSRRKALGCAVGFAGVMVVNLRGGTQGLDAGFTLLGEGFIVIAAFVLSAASIYGKRLSQRIDPMVMTGWQLGIGGLVLLLGGLAGGGDIRGWSAGSLALLGYMAVLSAVAFTLWAALLKHNRVGQVTVFNFLIPVFGALLSALFLGEAVLEWRNLAALVMVCGGIWLVTTEGQRVR
ncbi:DMT family transporter [Hydrogenophaga pseudoflava]|uniref:Putative DMT superfamily transporter inner membrane protein n=1 Tax=Hydrogenophaga pseudoflava TaxID=47421 RepID=A0A4P6WX17_HYDPS|nr:DMT family transporter [Hydrogenophaga pseudoflava]QBM27069.1 putative DMT superfamily transporter inner membrane protein [Hydrogenophaga pseudoflava]